MRGSMMVVPYDHSSYPWEDWDDLDDYDEIDVSQQPDPIDVITEHVQLKTWEDFEENDKELSNYLSSLNTTDIAEQED
jgi:hypothetical protein